MYPPSYHPARGRGILPGSIQGSRSGCMMDAAARRGVWLYPLHALSKQGGKLVAEDELNEATEDAPPEDIFFTPRERRLAEAFVLLQREQVRYGYWEARKVDANRRQKADE